MGYGNCFVLGTYPCPQYATFNQWIKQFYKIALDSKAMEKHETVFYAFLANFNFNSVWIAFFSSLGSEQQVKCQLFISLRLSFLLMPEIIWPSLSDYFQWISSI